MKYETPEIKIMTFESEGAIAADGGLSAVNGAGADGGTWGKWV